MTRLEQMIWLEDEADNPRKTRKTLRESAAFVQQQADAGIRANGGPHVLGDLFRAHLNQLVAESLEV